MPRGRAVLLWRHSPKRQNVWIFFPALPPTSWIIVAKWTRSVPAAPVPSLHRHKLCVHSGLCTKVQQMQSCREPHAALFYSGEWDELVKPLDPWQQGLDPETGESVRAKPTLPSGPLLADGAQGRKSQGGQSWTSTVGSGSCELSNPQRISKPGSMSSPGWALRAPWDF